MIAAYVARWAAQHPFSPLDVDCATTVMLKILDGKCKMAAGEKLVMACLYEQVKTRPGCNLGADIHRLIASARREADEFLRNEIYEKRLLAETALGRPLMKAFKAMIRQNGLLVDVPEEEEAA